MTDDATPAHVDIDEVLTEVRDAARPAASEGEVKPYIAELPGMDADHFGLVLSQLNGEEHAIGDVDDPFAMQSIAKVLSLVLAMQKAGEGKGVRDELWSRVGVEPSGDPFNSLVQLEHEQGKPRNPLINAGALVVDDILLTHCDDAEAELLALASRLAGEELTVNEDVAVLEENSSDRNRAIAHLMASFGNLDHDVDEVLALYNHQCAIEMTTRQLARAFRFLANDGVDAGTGDTVVHPDLARRVGAIMLTCGTYDAAGEFAFDVGLPCKSGVCGAIVGLAPEQASLATWSPPLDEKGNSMAGHVALRELSARLDLSVFKGPGSELF